jgi:two-component sensor histidine kinase
MVADNRPIKFKVQAENGEASSTEAVSIGLIVTELVLNALKHALSMIRRPAWLSFLTMLTERTGG